MHVRAETPDVTIAVPWSSTQGQFGPGLPGRWFVPDREAGHGLPTWSESGGGALMTFFILLVDSPAAIETLQEYQDSSRCWFMSRGRRGAQQDNATLNAGTHTCVCMSCATAEPFKMMK